MMVGIGGTLAYYAILFAIAFASSHFNSDAGMKIMMGLSFPLFPGMLPGGLLSLRLGFGFNDT